MSTTQDSGICASANIRTVTKPLILARLGNSFSLAVSGSALSIKTGRLVEKASMSLGSDPMGHFIAAHQGEADAEGFLQRGAVVAFTSPHLLGARIRQVGKEAARELVLPSLSGRAGMTVLPSREVATSQNMTMHDQALWQKLLHAPAISPTHVRTAIQEAATEGLRGRAAMAWAEENLAIDATALRRVFFLLLTDLIRRTEMAAESNVPPEEESLSYLRPRIGRAVGRIAKRLNTDSKEIEAALEALAGVFMPLGKHHDAVAGHTRQSVTELRSFVKELDLWTAPRRGSPRGVRAEFVLRKAYLSLSCADTALAELDRVMDDTTILLRAWQRDKQSVLRRVERPEWILDGWDIIIALWRQSEPSDREACLWEMSHLVPPLPKEVESWAGFPEGGARLRLELPAMFESVDWRRSRPVEFTARNETLPTGAHGNALATEALKMREAYMLQSTRSLAQPFGQENPAEDPVTRISGQTSRASDTVLRQVVAVLDAVPSRAMLDPIIEAARPRLKLLRPPRPITFARILFLPFDGALAPMKEWRSGNGKFPRPALMPIADAIRAAIGPAAEEINANLGGRNFFDVLQVDHVGRTLWAEAARHAPSLSFRQGLPEAGLSAAECAELCSIAAGIWRHASEIWEAKLAAFSGPSAELVVAALKGPAKEGPALFSIALASLLHQAQSPGTVLATAGRLSPIAGSIADEKLEGLQHAAAPSLPKDDPVRAAHLAEEYVVLLKELETAPAGRLTGRKGLIAPLLRNIGKASEETAQYIFDRQFSPALNNPNGKRRAAVVVNIEHLARALRRLEEAGRRAGCFEVFDTLRLNYARKLKATLNALDEGGLQRHDVVRIAEILLGTEQAMAMAGSEPKPTARR